MQHGRLELRLEGFAAGNGFRLHAERLGGGDALGACNLHDPSAEGVNRIGAAVHIIELGDLAGLQLGLPLGHHGLGRVDEAVKPVETLVQFFRCLADIDVAHLDDRIGDQQVEPLGAKSVVRRPRIAFDDAMIVGHGGQAHGRDGGGHQRKGGDEREDFGFDRHGHRQVN